VPEGNPMDPMKIRDAFEKKFPGTITRVMLAADQHSVGHVIVFNLDHKDRYKLAGFFVGLAAKRHYPGLTRETDLTFFTPEESQKQVLPQMVSAVLASTTEMQLRPTQRWEEPEPRTAKAQTRVGDDLSCAA
jgi:hypothetical protein